MAGSIIETKTNIQGRQAIMIGESYKSGVYFAIFTQGEKKKILQLVKL